VLSLVRLSVEGAPLVARVEPDMALVGADPRSCERSLEPRRDDELADNCESISITSSSSSSTWTWTGERARRDMALAGLRLWFLSVLGAFLP